MIRAFSAILLGSEQLKKVNMCTTGAFRRKAGRKG
jgi:hypothetical protein